METNLPEIKYQSHEMRDYFLYFDHLFTWVGLSYKAKFTQFDHLVYKVGQAFYRKCTSDQPLTAGTVRASSGLRKEGRGERVKTGSDCTTKPSVAAHCANSPLSQWN